MTATRRAFELESGDDTGLMVWENKSQGDAVVKGERNAI